MRTQTRFGPAWLAVLLGLWGWASGCGRAPTQALLPPAPPDSQWVASGRAIAGQAFALLSTNLAQALATGGITNALHHCSEEAVSLAATVATRNGVELRRVTHRPRNPQGRADARERSLLASYHAAGLRGVRPLPPVLVTNASGAVTFYSPIVLTNPLCLNCHGRVGQDVAAADLDVIRRLYPDDEATGFRLGDVRGLWKITFPAGRTPGL